MKLYFVKLDSQKYRKTFEFLENKLNSEEFLQANQFKFEKGKAVSAVSILLAKHAIRKSFGLTNYSIIKNRYGKPYIKDFNNCFFNISHSGDYVICGTSEYEIGVDIEQVKDFRDIMEIAKRFFSQKESDYLNSINNRENQVDVFYEIWTKKESFIKAVGQGVSLGLDNFTVPLGDNLEIQKILFCDNFWYFNKIPVFNKNFPVSICEKNNYSKEVMFESLHIEQL